MNQDDVKSGRVKFGKTAADYLKHRPGFPPSFFDQLIRKKHAKSGQSALDLGTGTGTIALGLAAKGLSCVGIDPSEDLLQAARTLDKEAAVKFVQGVAESIPLNEQFDLVCAGQCWHWFDPTEATAEIKRVLKPTGKLILANFDWKPEPDNVVDKTLKLIAEKNPHWTPETKPDFFRAEPENIPTPSGFELVENYCYVEQVPFTHVSWRGRIRASAAIGASMTQSEVDAFDNALSQLLGTSFSDPIDIPHFVITRIYEVKE